jgi:hypothetical protein
MATRQGGIYPSILLKYWHFTPASANRPITYHCQIAVFTYSVASDVAFYPLPKGCSEL